MFHKRIVFLLNYSTFRICNLCRNQVLCYPAIHIRSRNGLVRLYCSPTQKETFFSHVMKNIKQEMAKNKEMKENLKKFREEAEKLEQSAALKKARQKFQIVESEASRSREALHHKIGTIKEKLGEVIEEASKSEIAKKAGQITEELGKSARGAAETISERSQKSAAFQTLTQTASAVKRELDTSDMHGRVYKPPLKLRKRTEASWDASNEIVIKPNTEAKGMEQHKDFSFYQSWQNFKDNNPYINKMLGWKTQYDESENPMVRVSRAVTDKAVSIVGGVFQKTELSETLTEICKIDPNFEKVKFLRECETDIIPNILEAIVRGDLEILHDWCYDGPFHRIAAPLKLAKQMGVRSDSKILDIDNVDLAMGKMMEQGPVLIISFRSQQIHCLRDSKNNVYEGDPDKVLRVENVWVLCRDERELNPKAAWRLMDLSASTTEQLM